MTSAARDPLVVALLDARNDDGGWPATRPGSSTTEATALAVMALGATRDTDTTDAVAAGRRWLVSHQRADGAWPTTAAVDESSWMTAPAILGLAADAAMRPAALRGGDWLLGREGAGLGWFARIFFWLFPEKKATEIDTELTGWPWTGGTFSWIEPTAWALLALKKLGGALTDSRAARRVASAEALIYDRVCPGGGWNYGNARVMGESLSPYADTTALALMAVHDRDRREATTKSLDVLAALTRDSSSGLALGWTALCFDLYGIPSAPLRQRLREQYAATRFLAKVKPLALAVLAVHDGAASFRA
jgi:hypothetical protein